MVQITIRGIINDGIKRLRSYMSKGHTVGYSTSGVFDERIKTIKPGPNKLEGFIIVVIGFRRILWRPIEETISNYKYIMFNKELHFYETV